MDYRACRALRPRLLDAADPYAMAQHTAAMVELLTTFVLDRPAPVATEATQVTAE